MFVQGTGSGKEIRAEAKAVILHNLGGHRSIGGCVQHYNAMPMEGVDALIDFMKKFEEENK